MKLVKCRKCKEEVSKNEKVCPHCGEKNPGISNLETFLGLGIFIIICVAIYYFVSGDEKEASSTKETIVKTEVKATPKPFKYADMTLKEYRNEPQTERKEIVSNYVSYKDLYITNAEVNNFYKCLSEMSHTKSDELKLGDVLEWCYADYNKNPSSFAKHINFDEFMSKFSSWDGSYRPLTKLIKENMHDESTYKHIETTYRRVLNANPYAIVTTIFSGTNLYGARVKQSLTAKVDIKTGEIIELITER
ncbi:zinc ribbon domain-containing protein [Xenorhabdus thuongxuanensis]|uniref:Membrane protein n=1 Tax=Xenorhabdus thuongxuanensis TaxID=1873484 RepID=A0A1Q5U3F9_9GAMM|nr:zinc ribbon domain-containing protein [Xenorhabdus thuongxuanensis]OKP07014.1 membrane protein [Xenorhabdus thuongxuanensis]